MVRTRATMKDWLPALGANLGVFTVTLLFLVELSMPEELVLSLLVIMCVLLF